MTPTSLTICLLSIAALSSGAGATSRAASATAPDAKTAKAPKTARAAKASDSQAGQTGTPLRPINITSDRFEIMPNAERAIWTGSVVAERDDVRIACDRLTAEFGEKRKIRSVLCEGNVHMVQRQAARGGKGGEVLREAWGERAYFDNLNALVTVTGNPSAREGDNRIQGEKVLFYVEQDRVVIEKPRMVFETEKASGGAL